MTHSSKVGCRDATNVILLALLLCGGCAAPRTSERPLPPEVKLLLVSKQMDFALEEQWIKAEQVLRVKMLKKETVKYKERTIEKKEVTTEKREWAFHPEFFALPFAPLQFVFGATGALVLPTFAAGTYPIRWAVGVTADTVIVVIGGVTYVCQVSAGMVSMAVLASLNPPLKWTVCSAYLVADYVTVLPAAVDGLFRPSKRSPKFVTESMMLPMNVDIIALGNLMYKDEGSGAPSRYIPYESVTLKEFYANMGTKWVKAMKDSWHFTWDPDPVVGFFGGAAKPVWDWTWDVTSHFRVCGTLPPEKTPAEDSAFIKCLKFAVGFSRYSLLPLRQDGKWYTVGQPKVKITSDTEKVTDAKTEVTPCDILAAYGTIRAHRGDIPLKAPSPGIARQAVEVSLKSALESLCHDDRLVVSLTATPAPDAERRLTVQYEKPVADLRDPAGPRIECECVAPSGVTLNTGPDALTLVREKEVRLRFGFRSDTENARIVLWQISRDGYVIAGRARESGFDRTVGKGAGTEVAITLDAAAKATDTGKATRVEAKATDSEGRTSSYTLRLCHSSQ